MVGEDAPIRLGKSCQISAPSHKQVVDLLDEMTHRVSMRRRFNGQTVSKQAFLNNILVGIAELGPETWDYLFDHGASILGPALMAGEPGVPLVASRPLKKRFKWFSEGYHHESEEPPVAKPLPSTRLPKKKKPGDDRGGKGRESVNQSSPYSNSQVSDPLFSSLSISVWER